MLVFHSKLCPGFHCYRAKTGIQESITIPHYSGTMLAPSMLSFISFFLLKCWNSNICAQFSRLSSKPVLCVPGSFSWERILILAAWERPISVTRLTSSCASLSCIHRHTQTHVQTCIHTHHLESTDSTYQTQPKR